MVAGDWISDPAAVEKVITNAPKQIEELIKWGVDFDKMKKENSTFTRKEDIPNSEFFTTRTIQELKSRQALSKL